MRSGVEGWDEQVNADPLSGAGDDEQLEWQGDALMLVPGRATHEALIRQVQAEAKRRRADEAKAKGAAFGPGSTRLDNVIVGEYPEAPLDVADERKAAQAWVDATRAEYLRRSEAE